MSLRVRFASSATSIALLVACGGGGGSDGGAADAEVAPDASFDHEAAIASRPAITLDPLPPAMSPDDPLALSWEATGDLEGLSLLVEAHAPGEPIELEDPWQLASGAAVPTGATRWLQSDGTWSDSLASFGPAQSGSVETAWPSSDEGEWMVVIKVTDPGERVLAFAPASVLVASAPTLRLSVNRLAATPDDTIRAHVTVAHPDASEGTTIVAWREAPDGTIAALTLDAEGELGPVPAAARLTIMDERLLEEGSHRLEVRLLDAGGHELVAAGATMTVCDEAVSLSGRLRSSSGGALDGVELGRVVALDLDTREVRSAPLASDGTFEIELRPGSWGIALAGVSDGLQHEGEALVHLAGCGVTPAALELSAERTVPMPSAEVDEGDVGMRSDAVMAPPASDGLPRPTVYWANTIVGPGVTADQVSLFGDAIQTAVFTEVSDDVDMRGDATAVLVITMLRHAQLMGLAEYELEVVAGALRSTDADVMILTKMEHAAGRSSIYVKVVSLVGNGEILSAFVIRHGGGPGEWTMEHAREIARRLDTGIDQQPAETLLQQIRRAQDYPVAPRLSLTVSPIEARPSDEVVATATLRDSDGRTFANREVDFVCEDPDGTRTSSRASTNEAGVATVRCATSATLGVGSVYAEYERRNGSDFRAPPARFVVRDPLRTVRVEMERLVTRVNESIRVFVRGLSPGARVSLTASSGTLGETSATADASGTVETTFASPWPGPVEIGARPADDPAAVEELGFVYVGAPVAVSVLAEPTGLPAGGASNLRVIVASSRFPVSDRRLDLTASAGTLDLPVLTSDRRGEATTRWLAPASGSGTANVRAASMVEGQLFEGEVTLTYTDSSTPTDVLSGTIARGEVSGRVPGSSCTYPEGDPMECPFDVTLDGRRIPGTFSTPDGTLEFRATADGELTMYANIPASRPEFYVELVFDLAPGEWVTTTTHPEWALGPGGYECMQIVSGDFGLHVEYNPAYFECEDVPPENRGGSGAFVTFRRAGP